MTKLADLKNKLMASPEFQREYATADAEFQIIEALITARTRAKLSQAEVGRRVGTTQSAIARLEGGAYRPLSPRYAALPRQRARS